MDTLLTGLEQSDLAHAMRFWRWLYPAVNTLHILGISLLFGAIVPLDLKLLGLWQSTDEATLRRVLTPVAMTGLALAICAGALLFTTDATKYASLPLFQLKIGLVALAVANSIWLAQKRAAAAALISLCLWVGAIISGRFIGYL